MIVSTMKPLSPMNDFMVEQTNALLSWKRLRCNPLIIIVGDDAGVPEFCQSHQVINHKEVKKNNYGTPLVGDILRIGWSYCNDEDICIYINADIIVDNTLCDTLDAFVSAYPNYHQQKYFLTSIRYDWYNYSSINFDDPNWYQNINKNMQGNWSTPDGIDIFIHKKDTFKNIPDVAIAKWNYDTWLLNYAIKNFDISIDITKTTHLMHQFGKWFQDKKVCPRKTFTNEIREQVNIMGQFHYDYNNITQCKLKSKMVNTKIIFE